MSCRESIKKVIRQNRPLVSESTVKTYCSNIFNLGKKVEIDISEPKDVIKNADKIKEYFKDKPSRTRKTQIASLVVFIDTPENKNSDLLEKFRKIMMEDIHEVSRENIEQKLNTKQKQNWVEWDEVMAKYLALESEVKGYFNASKLSKSQFNRLQTYVLLSCLLLIAPRRSKDYTEFKLRNYDKNEDNYMLGSKFIFNNFKTAKSAGQQVVDIPKKLKEIITKWKKVNDSDYLLVNSRLDGKIDSSQLNNMLNNFFDKNVSTSLLRHIYLSNQYKDMPKLKELQDKADSMGTSVEMMIGNYIKHE